MSPPTRLEWVISSVCCLLYNSIDTMVRQTDPIEDIIEMVQYSYSTTSIHQLYIVRLFLFLLLSFFLVRMRSGIGHCFFFSGVWRGEWVGAGEGEGTGIGQHTGDVFGPFLGLAAYLAGRSLRTPPLSNFPAPRPSLPGHS